MGNKIKTIIKGVLISILIVLALESLIRVAKTIKDDIHLNKRRPIVSSLELGWRLRPSFVGNVSGKPCIVDENGFLEEDALQMKNKGEPRIVCVGDSWTFGTSIINKSTFVELLDDLLPDMSVINMAVPGYSSYQGYQVIRRRVLNLNPSLIVVSFNLNDRRYVLRKEDMDSSETFKRVYNQQKKQGFSNYFFLFQSLNYLKKKSYAMKPIDLRTLPARVPPDAYRENLTKIAAISKKENIPLIFLLQKENPGATEYLSKGMESLRNSDYDKAIESFKMAISLRNFFSILPRKYLTEIFEKRGQMKEANDILMIKDPFLSYAGGDILYFTEEYNEIMCEVAKENNIEVADPRSILDEESYIDWGHLNRKGHDQVSQLLYSIIKKIILTE